MRESGGHVVEGNQSLLPWEVQRIRKYLLSQNNFWGVQMWAMINLQIHLGLKHNDLINLKFSDILLNLSLIKEDCTVQSLFIQFNGKTNSIARFHYIIRLQLWADNQYPAMCPVRSLIGYIYLTGLKSGYVFPRSHLLGTIDHATEDGHQQLGTTFLSDSKEVYERITGNLDTYGTHTGRKTYYLLGVLGGADTIALKQGARQKKDSTVENYLQDAYTVKAMIEAEGRMHECEVSKWRSIYCNSETSAANIVRNSLPVQLDLYEIAKFFVEQTLRYQGDEI